MQTRAKRTLLFFKLPLTRNRVARKRPTRRERTGGIMYMFNLFMNDSISYSAFFFISMVLISYYYCLLINIGMYIDLLFKECVNNIHAGAALVIRENSSFRYNSCLHGHRRAAVFPRPGFLELRCKPEEYGLGAEPADTVRTHRQAA